VSHFQTRLVASALVVFAAATAAVSCQPPETPAHQRDPRAQKWLDRAKASYRVADAEEAHDAIEEALRVAPGDAEVRMVAANIALAKLDFQKVLKLTAGIQTTEAYALRGRALWYAGNVEAAGTELELLLRDPDVHDNWAKAVLQLTNRGAGRKPYTVSGNIVAVTEMPRIRGTALVVPIEVDGEQGLGLLATGTAEVVLDSSQRREPSWISLRITGRLEAIEFHDVPAITQDLSGVARQLGIPSIKALLGVNFLRHANPTFDFLAQQFVVRRFSPPRPPNATDVPIAYIRGGGMTVRPVLRPDTNSSTAAMLVDTAMSFPLALDAHGWSKAGVDPSTLRPVPEDTKLKAGVVPMVRLGAFDIPQVSGVLTQDVASWEANLGIDIDGVIGSGLVGAYRVTLGDGGHVMWLEEEAVGASTVPQRSPELSPETGPGPAGSSAPSLRLGPSGPPENKGPRSTQ
jgi:hypothetical protein